MLRYSDSQDPYDDGVFTGIPPPQPLFSPIKCVLRTPPRTAVCTEASFDSGFHSPPALANVTSSTSSTETPPRFTNLINPSPNSKMLLDDMNISDDWDRQFIANFEENLFALNELDEHMLEEILKSPQGKALLERQRCEQQALQQTQLVHSQTSSNFSTLGSNMIANAGSNNFKVLSPCDPNKMSATPVKQTANAALKLSKRKLTMSHSIPVLTCPTPKIPILPKENTVPGAWPAKERLKHARAQFKMTLAKAVQNAAVKPSSQIQHHTNAVKADKYPELKMALSYPASATGGELSLRQSSYHFIDSDEDEDETWDGPLPFTDGYHGNFLGSCHGKNGKGMRGQKRRLESRSFEPRDKSGGYKIKKQSECKMVLKKVRK